MSEVITQGHLILTRPDRPYELAEETKTPLEPDKDGYVLRRMGLRHRLPAAGVEVFTAKRRGGRQTITVIRVLKRARLTSDGLADATLAPGTWYVAEQ